MLRKLSVPFSVIVAALIFAPTAVANAARPVPALVFRQNRHRLAELHE